MHDSIYGMATTFHLWYVREPCMGRRCSHRWAVRVLTSYSSCSSSPVTALDAGESGGGCESALPDDESSSVAEWRSHERCSADDALT